MIAAALAVTLLLDHTPKPSISPGALVPASSISTAPRVERLQAVAVTLECTARANGRVENCRVLGETHPGLGFGEAAVALMRDVRVGTSERDVQFARTIQFLP